MFGSMPLNHRRRPATLVSWLAGFAWPVTRAAVIAGADAVAGTLHALPIVALHPQFGRCVLVRCAVLIAVLPLVAARGLGLAVAIVLTGTALGLQAEIAMRVRSA